MSSEYEKQLEEANQKLREQLEKETARGDALEKKLKANEWKGLKEPSVDNRFYNNDYETKILKQYYQKRSEEVLKDAFKSYKVMFQKEKP
jgi:hypothetical protein